MNIGEGRNFLNGRFLKGHIPHNKGKHWTEWMDGRKAKRVKRIGMANLHGRPDIGGMNKKAVIAVREDGSHFYFESAADAARKTGLTRRNITHCCQKKRRHCGAYRWFYYTDNEWLKIIKQGI